MHVRHPIGLRRLGAPGAEAFAILFTIESLSRALLASVIPLDALALLGDVRKVSILFFLVSFVGLAGSFAVPWLVRRTARRWVYSFGAVLLIGASVLFSAGTLPAQVLGMGVRVFGVVSISICVNLYIMDHISRRDFGRVEPKRIFYSAGAWTIGPVLGVYLANEVAVWAPYAVSAAFGGLMLGYFWFLRLTDSPGMAKPAGPIPRPWENVRRFIAQPRLVLAWVIVVGRNGWWGMYFIYTPIYAVQSGLGEVAGGLIVSIGNAFLFLIPVWGWCARRFGLRRVLVVGFAGCGAATIMAAFPFGAPWIAAALLLAACFGITILDGVATVPFMLAVKPRERPEMTAVYSTYRDIAELAPPGVFSLLLRVFELPAIFVAGGVGILALAALSRKLHPRLGMFRAPAAAPSGLAPGGGASPAPSTAAPSSLSTPASKGQGKSTAAVIVDVLDLGKPPCLIDRNLRTVKSKFIVSGAPYSELARGWRSSIGGRSVGP